MKSELFITKTSHMPVKNNKFLIILLSVLLLFSILTAIFFSFLTKKLTSELKGATRNTTTTKETQENSNMDSTIDWTVYVNEKYKYLIRYPKEWFIESTNMDDGVCALADENSETVEISKVEKQYCGFIGESLPSTESEFAVSVTDKFSDEEYLLLGQPDELINIAGVNAKLYYFADSSELPNIMASRLYIDKDDKTFVVFIKQIDTLGKRDPIFDLIVANFNFIN